VINLTTVVAACDVRSTCQRSTFALRARVDIIRVSVSSLGLPSEARRNGERRMVGQTGIEPAANIGLPAESREVTFYLTSAR
jgi:hypothetical protein